MVSAHRNVMQLMVKEFFEQDLSHAAHCLETLQEEQAVAILDSLPATLTADVFTHLQPNFAANLLMAISPDLFKKVIEKLDSQQGASLFILLSQEERATLLSHLPEQTKRQMQELLTYPENSAGRIMMPHFLAFHTEIKVKNAIQRIRLMAKKVPASYAYVVDHENHLVGVMNMHDLMLASPDAAVESVMRQEVFAVNCFMDREQVAEELSKRRFFAAPIVDNENRLLGVIKAEQLLEDVQEEATEDIQKMFGAGGDERAFSPILFSLKKRIPWLYVNLATAFLAGSVVAIFNDVIRRLPVLAVYLPVVAGQGGNAGSQSLVVVIRGLVMREIPPKKAVRMVLKEIFIGLVNGILIGVVTALAAWLWHKNPMLGLVVGLAMLVNLIVAGLTGAAIPLIMKAIGLDPAQCSNIILTTFTDVMGFLALLGFGMTFEHYLM